MFSQAPGFQVPQRFYDNLAEYRPQVGCGGTCVPFLGAPTRVKNPWKYHGPLGHVTTVRCREFSICFPWYIMVPWYHAVIQPWYHGTMLPWYYGTMVPWYHAPMLPWYNDTMDDSLVPWFPGTMPPWNRRAMVPWYNDSMVAWYQRTMGNGRTVLWYHGSHVPLWSEADIWEVCGLEPNIVWLVGKQSSVGAHGFQYVHRVVLSENHSHKNMWYIYPTQKTCQADF